MSMKKMYRNASTTFAVDDVEAATTALQTSKPLNALRLLLEAETQSGSGEGISADNPAAGRIEACWSYSLDCVTGVAYHPLIAAAHFAFSEHRPLTLSPDVIWVTIVQGLAQHVRLNAETYRDQFVSHVGKKVIEITHPELYHKSPENPWDEVVDQLMTAVRREAGDRISHFVSDFGTTGPLERMVSEVAVLDLVQPYFTYNVKCICGIPSISLEGNVDDWKRLRDKVELLQPFDLDLWLGSLRSICDQFVRAASGDVDLEHWRRICKIRAAYGTDIVNGWLAKLFPYLRDFQSGSIGRHNPLLEPGTDQKIAEIEINNTRAYNRGILSGQEVWHNLPGVRPDNFPLGLSCVPFQFKDTKGTRQMEFVAGTTVVTQDPESLSLRPSLGWAVRESSPIEQVISQIRSIGSGSLARSGQVIEAIERLSSESMLNYVPIDAIRFFTVYHCVRITLGGGQRFLDILPLADWKRVEWKGWRQEDTDRPWQRPHYFRIALTNESDEVLINLRCPDDRDRDAIYLYRASDPKAVFPGQRIASSFCEFLTLATQGGAML